MINETLSLLGRIDLAAPGDAIVLLDGDALEVNIIRSGERMTLLNLSHFDVTEEGERVPVDPLPIQITIEKGGGEDKVEQRPGRLGVKRKPRAKAAKGRQPG